MRSTVSSRGHTTIPAEIRKKLKLKAKTQLEWIEENGTVLVIPVPEDPLSAIRGKGKGKGSVQDLLDERRKDRIKEEALEALDAFIGMGKGKGWGFKDFLEDRRQERKREAEEDWKYEKK